MKPASIAVLARLEVTLRLRRLSTLVAVLLTAMLSWSMIVDPASGHALMVIDGARVRYTSSALAMGSAVIGAMLFGLGGFYLARGRIGEDLRSGTGGVIGASAVSNASFLVARWVGAVAYLALLVLSFMATMLVLHLVRGEGPLEIGVYLGTYAMLLLPMVLYACACAVLFDSVPLLMGKGGDILFFFLWIFQLSSIGALAGPGQGGAVWPLLFDMTGILVAARTVQDLLHSTGFAIGASAFKPHLPALLLPSLPWDARALLLRAGAGLLAVLPLLPAVLLFHRFSPDRVKASRAHTRRSPLALLNQWTRPLARLSRPLLAAGARLPGLAGQAVAEFGLSVASAPFIVLALGAAVLAASLASLDGLGAVVTASVAVWGVIIAGVATRDGEAGLEAMTASVGGGEVRRFWRQWLACWGSGLLFTGVAVARWLPQAPLRAQALLAGVFALAALAMLLGRTSRSQRTFLGPFLFCLYVMVNDTRIDWIDAVGATGAASLRSVLVYLGLGLLATLGAWAHARRPH